MLEMEAVSAGSAFLRRRRLPFVVDVVVVVLFAVAGGAGGGGGGARVANHRALFGDWVLAPSMSLPVPAQIAPFSDAPAPLLRFRRMRIRQERIAAMETQTEESKTGPKIANAGSDAGLYI